MRNRHHQILKDNDFQFFKTEVPVDALKEDYWAMDQERFMDELQINAAELKHIPSSDDGEEEEEYAIGRKFNEEGNESSPLV